MLKINGVTEEENSNLTLPPPLLYILLQSTLERKKKNFSFSRKFPFMKSKEDVKSDDSSDNDRKSIYCQS